MLKTLREQVKRTPIIGPALHGAYLRAFYREGEILKIAGGKLRGRNWIRFMRTHNDEYVKGDYELDVQDALISQLNPGMTFYDIGANAGFFSLLGAEIVGPSGKVLAFEPHPQTAAHKQLRINKIQNVEIIQAAACARIGYAKLSDDTASVMASLGGAASAATTVMVRTTTLDHELSQHPAPDVIKLDAEGAEEDILAGATKVLGERRPVIIFECWSDMRHRIFHIFRSHNYSIRDLTGTPLSAEAFAAANNLNYVAIPLGPLAPILVAGDGVACPHLKEI